MLLIPPLAMFNWPSERSDLRILVPLDGSLASWAGLRVAVDLAKATGGRITLVQALLPPTWANGARPPISHTIRPRPPTKSVRVSQ